jgi:hypothetical protein
MLPDEVLKKLTEYFDTPTMVFALSATCRSLRESFRRQNFFEQFMFYRGDRKQAHPPYFEGLQAPEQPLFFQPDVKFPPIGVPQPSRNQFHVFSTTNSETVNNLGEIHSMIIKLNYQQDTEDTSKFLLTLLSSSFENMRNLRLVYGRIDNTLWQLIAKLKLDWLHLEYPFFQHGLTNNPGFKRFHLLLTKDYSVANMFSMPSNIMELSIHLLDFHLETRPIEFLMRECKELGKL